MEKRIIKSIISICTFIAIVNMPFITITQLMGLEAFIDTFDNSESYQYFKSNKLDLSNSNGDYVVIQKSSHKDFLIREGDEIFYLKDEGGLICRKVYHISSQGLMKKYYTINYYDKINDKPIYEDQVIGKVVGVIDDNIWNSISLKV